MKYGFDVAYNIPDLISWSQNVRDRNDRRAEQRKQAAMQLMQMLGRGVGAYKMGKDYRAWKADQKMWDDELNELNTLEKEYDAAQDKYDIDAADRLISNLYKSNPYAIPGDVGASQQDFILYNLGLR